jgi:phosphatidylglycerol:prolipoprotein diacylglycerol transferase
VPDREAFRIGPFDIFGLHIDIPVHWYGIVIMLGVIVASWLAFREARRRRENPDHVWQMFPWMLIAGIVGARAGFIVSQLGDPRYQDIGNWFRIWEGGLSIQGSIIGGVVALILYCKRYSLSFFKWTDIIVPGLAVAQGIGRWGNFFNQEAFGSRCDLPWCIPISVDQQRAVAGIQNPDPNARFHPTFAYEMILDFALAGLLFWLGRQKKLRLREGDLLWVYLIVYSIGRFIIEQIRVDSATVGGLKTPALIALLTIIVAWAALIYRHRPTSTVPYSEMNLPDSELPTTTATLAGGTTVLTPATQAAHPAPTHKSRVRVVDVPPDAPGPKPAQPATPLPTNEPQPSE